jgi:transglutaminase-like putative cysteine protease
MSVTRSQVAAELVINVTKPALLLLSVAAARTAAIENESLQVTVDSVPISTPITVVELTDGALVHRAAAPCGLVIVTYSATVTGPGITGARTSERELLEYLRPSRFAPSDRLLVTARSHFGELTNDRDRLAAVVTWVCDLLWYVPGTSSPGDDAIDTMLAGQGVCRDYAHLVTAMLRALEIPARLVSVYAPGLDPMDFHAVVEAWVDGRWTVVDATHLAPRKSLVRIATGRDAADTAFLTVLQGATELQSVWVSAVAAGLPNEDWNEEVTLG